MMMLQRITQWTRQFSRQLVIVVCLVVMAFAAVLQMSSIVGADQYQDRINALQADVNRYQAAATELSIQASNLQAELNRLTAQKQGIQAEVHLSQAKHDKLVADIAATEKRIAENQDALGEIIADLYVDDQISGIELIASSENIGDFLNKQEYRTVTRDQLTGTIAEVKTLRTQLNDQRDAVAVVLAEQKQQLAALREKENEQAALVAQTQGQQAAYEKLVGDARAAIERAAAEQRAYWANRNPSNGGNAGYGGGGGYVGPAPQGPFEYRNFSGNTTCGGGYPTSRSDGGRGQWGCGHGYGGTVGYNVVGVDKWALYNRECVSYVAWAAAERFGKYVTGFGGRGMAYQFGNTASGYPMYASFNNTPAVGAVAVLPPIAGFAPVGHVMIVEQIYGDGWIKVSQYNFGGTGQYSTMDIKATGVTYVHFR